MPSTFEETEFSKDRTFINYKKVFYSYNEVAVGQTTSIYIPPPNL